MRRKKAKNDEPQSYRKGSAAVAGGQKRFTKKCSHCKRNGHVADRCFRNPESGSYKGENFGWVNNDPNKKGEGSKKQKKKKPVLAMAFANICNEDYSEDFEDFILDSGASHHICVDLSLLHSKSKIDDMEITLADASVVNCDTVGKVDLMLDSENGDPVWIRLNDVLYIKEMCMNLISPAVLDDHGISTIFGNGTCKMVHIKSNELIGTASKDNSGGLYKVHGHVKRDLGKGSANIASGLELWHKRLGHLPYRAVKSMAKRTKGINLEDKPEKIDCTDCVEGKSKNGSH